MTPQNDSFLTVTHNQTQCYKVHVPGKFSCVNTTPMSAGMLSNPQVPTMWMPARTASSWN